MRGVCGLLPHTLPYTMGLTIGIALAFATGENHRVRTVAHPAVRYSWTHTLGAFKEEVHVPEAARTTIPNTL